MKMQVTNEQFKAMRKAAKKDLNAERPVVFLFRSIDDIRFEILTPDVYIILRYDPLLGELFAETGKKVSLAAVVASDDQIFTHVVDQLFALVADLTEEELAEPDEDSDEDQFEDEADVDEEECDENGNPIQKDINSDVDPENPPTPEPPKSDS